MGTGTCAPIEAGPRGTRIKDSWIHAGGDIMDAGKSLWGPSIPLASQGRLENSHTALSG